MIIKKIKFIIILILFINNNKIPTKNISNKNIDNNNYLIIEKLNLKLPFYNINSKNNTIDKNIELLKESIMPDKNNRTDKTAQPKISIFRLLLLSFSSSNSLS